MQAEVVAVLGETTSESSATARTSAGVTPFLRLAASVCAAGRFEVTKLLTFAEQLPGPAEPVAPSAGLKPSPGNPPNEANVSRKSQSPVIEES